MSKPTRRDVATGTMLFMVGGYAMLLMIVVSGCVRSVSPSPAAVTAIGSDDHQLKAEHVAGGSQAERLATADGADLVLLFGGETRGDLRPCGCEDRPAGGLARVASHVQAVRAAGDPVLVLRSGAVFSDVQTLDGQLPSETTETNAWMSEALAELGVDALNLTPVDLPAVAELDAAVVDELGVVSANVQAPGVPLFRRYQLGDLRVVVTGVSRVPAVLPQGDSLKVIPPVRALRAVFSEIEQAGGADVVVLAAWHAPEAARFAARSGWVDVVVDAQRHQGRFSPVWLDEAVWVRSPYRDEKLGELRLHMQDGEIDAALDRRIDLGPGAPEHESLMRLTEAAETAIEMTRENARMPSVRSTP